MHETWAKYDLPKDVPLIKKTLLGHLRLNHKILVAHRGPSSPMEKVEALLLEMILLLGNMHTPVTCREGLELANSIVKGTTTEDQIIEWEKKTLTSTFQ